jgi:hypothetical protein
LSNIVDGILAHRPRGMQTANVAWNTARFASMERGSWPPSPCVASVALLRRMVGRSGRAECGKARRVPRRRAAVPGPPASSRGAGHRVSSCSGPIKPNHVAELPFSRDPPANSATGDLRCEWIHFQPFGEINRPSQPLPGNGAQLSPSNAQLGEKLDPGVLANTWLGLLIP